MSNVGKVFTTTKGEEITVKEYDLNGTDLTGQVFGERVVLGFAYVKGKFSCWVVRCSCGKIDVIKGVGLKKGVANMCKACADKKKSKDMIVDLTGQVFGEREVLGHALNTKKGPLMWKVRCSCGKIDIVQGVGLKSGKANMCKDCMYKKTSEGMEESIKIGEGGRCFSDHYITKIINRSIGNVRGRLKQYFPHVEPVLNPFGGIAGYYMTEEQTRKILSILRTRTPEAQALLEELSGVVVDDSTESEVFRELEEVVIVVEHFHGIALTIKRNVKGWEFFIPEAKLYVGFEQGKVVKGVNTMIIDNKIDPYINARKIEDKIVELLA